MFQALLHQLKGIIFVFLKYKSGYYIRSPCNSSNNEKKYNVIYFFTMLYIDVSSSFTSME